MSIGDRARSLARSPAFGWWALLSIAMFALIAHFYGHVLASPDKVVMSGSGDGLKNYYTLLWHANHDRSWLGYTGSSYPFGERVFYTDGHPLLSWVLQLLPGLAPHAVGTLNLLLLLGLILCAWCLFALLRELSVAPWAAAIGAFAITMLQPQLLRMGGHYSLAHPWFIPLFLLLSVRMHNRLCWHYPMFLAALSVLVAFLTHPYLGLTGSMILLAHGLCRASLGPGKVRAIGTALLRAAVPALLPMLLFMGLLGAGDAVLDRPTGPLGADAYATRCLSLLIPTHDPLHTPLREFVRYDSLEWETWCYLGLAPILVLVVAGGVQLQRWSMKHAAARGDEAGALLAAASLVLLFAMGVWQEWIGGRLPLLEQFRSTGRFAWAFFYASGVFCVVRTHQWLLVDPARRKPVSAAAFILVVGFMALEGWDYHRQTSDAFGHARNPFHPKALSAEQRAFIAAIHDSRANALLPLPWMHTGSERYARHAPERQLGFILPVAYHSGVPLIAGITSRASLQQTRDLFAVFAPSYFPKRLREALPPETRILLVRHADPLSPEEEDVWARGHEVFSNAEGSLRAISPAELLHDDRAQRLARYHAVRDSLPLIGGHRFSCDGHPAPPALIARAHFGADSLSGMVNEFRELIGLQADELDTAVSYELSFLYRAQDPADMNNNVIPIRSLADWSGGEWEELHGVRGMPMQFDDGVAVASIRFQPRQPQRAYKFLLNGPATRRTPYTVEHLLLRPVGLDIWREGRWMGRPAVFLNNVPLNADAPAASP